MGEQATVQALRAVLQNETLSAAEKMVQVRALVWGEGALVLAADPCTDPQPVGIWGALDAASISRHELFSTGGPGRDSGPFRRLTVVEGDDFYGARCELGHNERRFGDQISGWDPAGWTNGTFALYREGERRTTRFALRLPEDFPIEADLWQGLAQWKQAQPYPLCGNVPMLDIGAFGGVLRLTVADPAARDLTTVWSCPAPLGEWLHLRLDALYSTTPQGWVKLQVRRGRTVWASEKVQGPNLLRSCTAYADGDHPEYDIAAGDPIPSHLRLGVYHHPDLPTTHADYAKVEVWG